MSDGRFRRMVVGLPQGMANGHGLEAALDLARLLNIELHGAFLCDNALFDLAGFPGPRELRLLEGLWQPIELGRIVQEVKHAAELARRRFTESLGRRGIKAAFDVVGTDLMAALIRSDDIVTVIEPSHPADRITKQFTAFLEMALATAAAVLLVPRRNIRTSGPILVVATGASDPGIAVAVDIAGSLHERLIVAGPAGLVLPAEVTTKAERLGIVLDRVIVNASGWNHFSERLQIIDRSLLAGTADAFARMNRAPLLLV